MKIRAIQADTRSSLSATDHPVGALDQTSSRLHDQCAYETEIAAKLRNASRTERVELYGRLYGAYQAAFPEIFHEPNDHPAASVNYELAFATRFVSPDTAVAEIGPGRCELATALAARCQSVFGVDVVDMSPPGSTPSNFKFVQTDGSRIPLPDESVGLVISNQLMEHVHPDDATYQLREILRILQPGGCYICITPNRLHGPHDTSAYFDDLPCPVVDGAYVANGLHLKEYTNLELYQLFRDMGFCRCRLFAGARGRYVQVPAALMGLAERGARRVPLRLRKRSKLFQALLGVRIVAEK